MTSVRVTLLLIFITTLVYGQEHSFDTLLVNNRQTFQLSTTAIHNHLLLLTSTTGTQTVVIDTIASEGLTYIKYPDFNKDGNADILMDYSGNNSTFFLYLFDPLTNTFKAIDNYFQFPNAVQLKTNNQYYYSYHRAGCADMNWVSDLFTIRDFKIIHLGHIYGKGCDPESKEDHQVIDIYKVTKNNPEHITPVEQLPYQKFIPKFGDKWLFIQQYWNKNYTKFE